MIWAVSLLAYDLITLGLVIAFEKIIWSFHNFGKIYQIPRKGRVLYLFFHYKSATLYLNRFRGKPAITKFDQPFTPKRNFLRSFATDSYLNLKLFTSSFLSRLDHLVSGLIKETYTLQKICFRYAFFYRIKLATFIKLLNHYTKGKIKIPDIFDFYLIFYFFICSLFIPFQVSLSSFPHGTSALSDIFKYISFEGGSTIFIQISY